MSQRLIDAPVWEGFGARFTDLQLADRATWNGPSSAELPGQPLTSITVVPKGFSQVHEVNVLDPASTGWLEPPGAFAAVIPARRP